MKPRCLLLNAALIAACPPVALHAQVKFPPDSVVEKVVCPAFPGQSYALYLPPQYRADLAWPILYLFDPRGRGKLAARLFEDAARDYGYMIASSNNSRSDGPIDPNITAIRAIWNDTHLRFSIDPRRVYASGFSGGARVACLMGTTAPGTVAGVIACGGGFHRPPDSAPPFLFFGTAGLRDFNYDELLGLDRTLSNLGSTHRIEVFDGEHQWAPAELCREAVEWMELGAMRAGDAAMNEDWISCWLERARRDFARARAAQRDEEAFHLASHIVGDFSGIREVGAERAFASDYGTSPEHLRREKARAQRLIDDDAFRHQAAVAAAKLKTTGVPLSEGQLLQELRVPELRHRMSSNPGSEDALAAERLLNEERVQLGFYLAEGFFGEKDYSRAILCLTLAADIRPEQPQVWYDLAAGLARAGEKKKAWTNLQRAVSLGFDRADVLEADPDFESLRPDPRFAEIVAAARASRAKASAPR